jgi:hypothetical protein
MTAALARRIAELEARRGVPREPGAAPAWLRWATGDEVDQLEQLYRAVETGAREPTESDQLLCIEVEAAATRLMLAGEPPPA